MEVPPHPLTKRREIVTDSFAFAGGIRTLREYGITSPVYSEYPTAFPQVAALSPSVWYSYPEKVSEDETATEALSKDASTLISSIVSVCKEDTVCALRSMSSNGLFDMYGIYNRKIILKQVTN